MDEYFGFRSGMPYRGMVKLCISHCYVSTFMSRKAVSRLNTSSRWLLPTARVFSVSCWLCMQVTGRNVLISDIRGDHFLSSIPKLCDPTCLICLVEMGRLFFPDEWCLVIFKNRIFTLDLIDEICAYFSI